MSVIHIVPDSSFYICFLGDIDDCDSLLKILRQDKFNFIMSIVVKGEISKSSNYLKIKDTVETKVEYFSELSYGELLRPLFSREEIEKGEHEVITLSFILSNLNYDFITILDDKGPRNFFKTLLPECHDRLRGTIGFIGDCVCTHNVFRKEKGINILIAIKNSKFRIKEIILDDVIKRVRGC